VSFEEKQGKNFVVFGLAGRERKQAVALYHGSGICIDGLVLFLFQRFVWDMSFFSRPVFFLLA
jgi:hypothetical protein